VTCSAGGSIGLAVLGTVAWTVVAGSARSQASTAAYRHALATGFDRAFLVAAAIAVLTLVVAITTIRIRRADLSGG
jgi:electron transfer flavoprotein alpha/beta subunit